MPEDPRAAVARLRPGGRAATKRGAILAAAREILAEGGVRDLTVERVAARSGVAKTTVYRRWRDKHELALAVLIDMVESLAPTPELGDTRAELVSFLDATIMVVAGTPMGDVVRGLVPDLGADSPLGRAFRERVAAVRLADARRVIERGIERGALRTDLDVELLLDLLLGPVYYRLLLGSEPLRVGFAERVVDAVLPAFAVRAGSRQRDRPSARV